MDTSSTSTLETVGSAARSCCAQCQAPLEDKQMVCPACGYYASLGRCVEIDSQWEEEVARQTAGVAAAPANPMEQLFSNIPTWVWILVGTNLAIVALCVAGRFTVASSGTTVQTYWGVSQLFLGITVAATLHILSFVRVAAQDSDIGVFDIVVSPLKAWLRIFAQLPHRAWVVITQSNAVVAVLAALLIVGGIPYDRLWDWGIEPPPKTNLMAAVMAQAQKAPSKEGDLEDAIGDFAGQAGDLEAPAPKPSQPVVEERKKTDCLIVGYNVDLDGRLVELLLATELYGKLVFAGEVTPRLSRGEETQLLQKFRLKKAAGSIVRTGREALWLDPKFICRVTYASQNQKGRLLELKWESMLNEVAF